MSRSSSSGEWRRIGESEVEMEGQIGGGGVAMVHRARWGGRLVAVKTLFDPKLTESLRQDYLDELGVMSELSHPNVVSLLGANMTPPRMFFVMELCERSLFEAIHRSRVELAPSEKLRMALEIAEGMSYLHSRRPPVIHRDLKPQNVLEAPDGSMKICDFGLVRARQAGCGTPAYMAPELFEGRSISTAVDVYAFGVLLCELFSGVLPFREYDYHDVSRAVCRGDRPPLPRYDAPDDVRRLIVAAWGKTPTARPSFNEAKAILAAAKANTRDRSHCDDLAGGDCLDDLLAHK